MVSSGRRVCSLSANATFSNTVMSVNRADDWNSMPMSFLSSSSSARRSRVTSRPCTRTSPESGLICPPMILSRVVLPQPLGPIRAVILPRGTVMLSPSKITRAPRRNTRSRISIRLSSSASSDSSSDSASDIYRLPRERPATITPCSGPEGARPTHAEQLQQQTANRRKCQRLALGGDGTKVR